MDHRALAEMSLSVDDRYIAGSVEEHEHRAYKATSMHLFLERRYEAHIP